MKPNLKAVLINSIAISFSLTLLINNKRRRKKKAEQLLADFYELADEFNFFISKQEVLGRRVIAFDDINNRLLFFAATNDKREGYLIELDKVKTSAVKKEYAVMRSDYNYRTNRAPFVNTIVMQLNYKNGAMPLALPFYEKASDSVFAIRVRAVKAIEWQSLLSNRLTKEGLQPRVATSHSNKIHSECGAGEINPPESVSTF